MTRSFHQFPCEDALLAGTLDAGQKPVGLLIVSGGNEIRSGAHTGMSGIARELATQGYSVFRYDRRGIGESSGTNLGFLESGTDINAAVDYFRQTNPKITKIVAFGNCDAASALAFFGDAESLDSLVLANPWVIEDTGVSSDSSTVPPPSAIRSRYWDRLKNPQSIIDLFTGKIDLRKLANGLKQATQKQENTDLSIRIGAGLTRWNKPCKILLASRDTTARAFLATWNSKDFSDVRTLSNITTETLESASHSFADEHSKGWLEKQLLEALETA